MPTIVRIAAAVVALVVWGERYFDWGADPGGADSYRLDLYQRQDDLSYLAYTGFPLNVGLPTPVGGIYTYQTTLPPGNYYWNVRAILGGVAQTPSADEEFDQA